MTAKELKTLKKIANQTEKAVSFAQKKQAELRVLLSLTDIKAGRVTEYRNVDELFKKLKVKA